MLVAAAKIPRYESQLGNELLTLPDGRIAP
jgi:hypothetical protein